MRAHFALLICVHASGLCAQPFDWQWSVAPTGGQTLFGSATDAEGNTYLAGSFNFYASFPPLAQLTTSGAETDGFVAKYDPNGVALWAVPFTGTTNDECRGISVDALGAVYVTGFFTSPTLTIGGETLTRIGTQDAFVSKLGPDGTCLWALDLSTGVDDVEQGTSITSAPNGDTYVTGYFKGTFEPAGSPTLTSCVNGSNLFLLKLDTDGAVLWSRSPVCPSQPSYGESYGQVVHVDNSGNLFLAGAYRGATCTVGDSTFVNYSESSNNLLWAKFTSAGDLLWVRSFGENGDDRVLDIDTDPNGNAYLALERGGTYNLPEFTIPYNTGGSFNWRTLALKCDPNGTFLWYERVGGSTDAHRIWSIKVLTDGSFLLGGEFIRQCTFDSFTIPWNDFDEYWSLFLARYNPAGVAQEVFVRRQATARAIRGITTDEAGNVYVARVAMGSNPRQTLRAIAEAEAYDGPSLILAYSHCIAHGIDMAAGLKQQKLAVDSGHWPLFRYHPDLAAQGQNPFQLDSKAPSIPLKDYIYNEVRYRMLSHSSPDEAARLLKLGQEDVQRRWKLYEEMAGRGSAPAQG